MMEHPQSQDLPVSAPESATAEWREEALVMVDRHLDLIRCLLSQGSEGFRFGNATIAAFDVAAKKVLQAMHDGIVLFDPNARKRSPQHDEILSTRFNETSAASSSDSRSHRYSSLPNSAPRLYRNPKVAGADEAR